jgi:hypothetical protein
VLMGIVVIMLVVGVTLGSTLFVIKTTQMITQKTTLTTAQTITQTYTTSVSVTTTLTTVTTPYNRTSQLYEIMFNQSGFCNPPSFLIPWSVTLEISVGMSITLTQPSNFSVQCCGGSPSYRPYSSIVFTVPNGTYSYAVVENGVDFIPSSGNVTVDGHNVTVMLQGEVFSCGTIAITSSSSS